MTFTAPTEPGVVQPPAGLLALRRLRRIKQFLGRVLIPRLPVNRHVFNHVRAELNAMWVRVHNTVNPRWIYRKTVLQRGHDLLVNVGCGPFGEPGWINLDVMQHPNVTLRWDCRRRLPLREGSAAAIRVEQFLEHQDHIDEVPGFLESCYRCLKRGGVLRVVVPDAERFLRTYVAGTDQDWIELGWRLDDLPDGFRTRMDILNHVFHQRDEHLYAYDYETLETALRRAGFENVKRAAFGVSACESLRNDQSIHRNISLYVEAIK